jgi:hypothetical protein
MGGCFIGHRGLGIITKAAGMLLAGGAGISEPANA